MEKKKILNWPIVKTSHHIDDGLTLVYRFYLYADMHVTWLPHKKSDHPHYIALNFV